MKAAVPILRSFEEQATRAFYVDFLEFNILFEHRFTPDAPLYMGLRKGDCEVHVSEHFGDGTPGTFLRIEVGDVAALSAALGAKNYRHAKPGWQRQSWGWDEMAVSDPAGNKLIFASPYEDPDAKKADR